MKVTAQSQRKDILKELGKQEKLYAEKKLFITANSPDWTYSMIQMQIAEMNAIKARLSFLKSIS